MLSLLILAFYLPIRTFDVSNSDLLVVDSYLVVADSVLLVAFSE